MSFYSQGVFLTPIPLLLPGDCVFPNQFSFNKLLDSQESLRPIIFTAAFMTIKEDRDETHGPEPGTGGSEVKPHCGLGVGWGEVGWGGMEWDGGRMGWDGVGGVILLAWNTANRKCTLGSPSSCTGIS